MTYCDEEGRRFAGAGLGLRNRIVTRDDRGDSFLLN
jgi:hypothetical protein